MKKLFFLLLALIPCFVQAQQTYWTPAVPPSSLSFTPTFRFKNSSVDSLNNIYLAIGNKWYQVYTAVQANARFTGGGGGGTTTFPLTINNSGSGVSSGTTFNGAVARTISWNSIGALPLTFPSNQTITLSGDTLKFGAHGTFIADSTMAAVGNQGFASMLPASFRLGKNLTTWLSITGGSSANTITGNPINITPKVSFAVNPALGATSTVGYVPTATNTSGDWSWAAPTAAPTTIYSGDGSLAGNRTIGLGSNSLEWAGDNGTWALDLLWDNTAGGSQISLQAANHAGSHRSALKVNAQSGYENIGLITTKSGNVSSVFLDNATGQTQITDAIGLLGGIYSNDYTTNQRLQRLSIPSVNTVIALADSVKATITPGTGTVTSITPGVGFLSHTPITASGTMNIDTTSTIQTIANFKPLGSTYWLSKTATSNSTLITLSALSLPYSQLTGTPSLSSYLTAIGVTTANGVSGTSSGGTTPNLTIALGDITPTSISTTIKPATIYQTATGTAGTDSIMVKHSGGVVNAISPTYYATSSSLSGYVPTITTVAGFALSSNVTLAALTMNNGGSGAASGTTFDGSTSRTISYNTIGAAPLASPSFTGTVTMPTPFTLGAISVTATGTQLNYLNAASGTTGTTSTNVVFSTSPTLVTPVLGAATGTSLSITGQFTTTAGAFVNSKNGIGTTTSDGVMLQNATAATVGTQNQYTSLFHQTGRVWNTSGTPASNQYDFSTQGRGVPGITPGAKLFWMGSVQVSTISYTDLMSLDNSGNLVMLTGTLQLKGFTVSTLPTGVQGMTAYVTDALTPSFGTTLVGGGAIVTKAFYNGSSWIAE